MIHLSRFGFYLIICFSLIACADDDDKVEMAEKEMEVTVSAFNSVAWQTTATDSDIAAWGDTLRAGMQVIAVSRDMPWFGVGHNREVRIEGLEGTFVVLDKMNSRFKKHVDLYMGEDVEAAREWGRKKRKIYWSVEKESKYDKRYQYEAPEELAAELKK